MLEHRAVVPVNRDGRPVCVWCIDGDFDDVPVEENANPAGIVRVRQDRDIVEVSMIDVHGDRKCVRVDKKRVQVDVESVPVSRDDGPEPIDDDRRRRNSFSVCVERVSADMNVVSADKIVVDPLLNDVDVDRDVVDALRDRVQVDLDVVQVDRDIDDGFENGGHPSKNRVFPASDENSPSTIAVPVDRDVVDGFRDALDVDIDAN